MNAQIYNYNNYALFSPDESVAVTASMSTKREDSTGVLGKLSDTSVYDIPPASDIYPSEDIAPVCRQGKSGTK